MRKVIRLIDSNNCRGHIVCATNRYPVDEASAEQQFDQDAAPIKSLNKPISTEADLDWSVSGLSVVLEGYKLSCGALLLSAA